MSNSFKMDPLITDELKHHGVKGMKWGVRKNRMEAHVEGEPKVSPQEKRLGEAEETVPTRASGRSKSSPR